MGELGQLSGNMSKKKVEALMAKLDTDGDGKITLEEFRGLFKEIKQWKLTESNYYVQKSIQLIGPGGAHSL